MKKYKHVQTLSSNRSKAKSSKLLIKWPRKYPSNKIKLLTAKQIDDEKNTQLSSGNAFPTPEFISIS